MKTNEVLQRDVENALRWEPLLQTAEIGVIAKDGVITLTGEVDSYGKQLGAEHAAKSVAGVDAVFTKIEIKFGSKYNLTDSDIATNALKALSLNTSVPKKKVTVEVEKGYITLDGEVTWNYQKEAALNAVNLLIGVSGVSNNITIKPESSSALQKDYIEAALTRHWATKNQNIQVGITGTTVTLRGAVNSWFESQEAERIAWKSPGVWSVENKLLIKNQTALVD